MRHARRPAFVNQLINTFDYSIIMSKVTESIFPPNGRLLDLKLRLVIMILTSWSVICG